MKIIAHRGLLTGPDTAIENSPDQISRAFDAGFDIEVDVWCRRGQWFTGHDAPQYQTTIEFLNRKGFWLHFKDIETYNIFCEAPIIPYCDWFFHEKDERVFTANGYVWTYPGFKLPNKNGIAVLPEKAPNWDLDDAYAVCTDYPSLYVKFSSR